MLAIPATVDPLTLALKLRGHVVPAAIELLLQPLALAFELGGEVRLAMILRTLGAAVELRLEALAFAFEALFDALATVVEAGFGAITTIDMGGSLGGGKGGEEEGQGEGGQQFHDSLQVRMVGKCAVQHGRERLHACPVDCRPAGFSRRYDGPNGMTGRLMADGMVALYIFMLAAIAGHVIIARVPVILHTPLMSGSNFIHGIVLIGAIVVLGQADTTVEKVIGFLGVLLGAGNAAGGYVVTERMLDMFKASRKPGGRA